MVGQEQLVSELGEKQKTLEAKNVNPRQEPKAELVCQGHSRSRGKEGGRETRGTSDSQKNSLDLS